MEKKILVVDDDEVLRNLFEQVFKDNGYSVWAAESAEQALEILEKEDIPVMFLDLQLPGITGEQLCCNIRTNNPIAIISAVTGYASRFELALCRDAGFDDYFTKPVDIKTLLAAAAGAFEKLERWGK